VDSSSRGVVGATITDPGVLEAQASATRARDHASEDGEYRDRVRAVATPVRDPAEGAIAALVARGTTPGTGTGSLIVVKARMALLLVAGLVTALVAAAGATGAPRTERFVYTPFAADGSLRADLTAVNRAGDCFTTSSQVPRQGVYRCITGHRLRDPCYVDPNVDPSGGSPVVICPSGPWQSGVVRIALDGPLPGDAPLGFSPRPWALELAGGARCLFGTGASNIVRGYRLNYVCSQHRYLFGSPRRSSPTWRIRASRSIDGRRMHLVAIRRAWR
jgi:hypothetical protein